LASRKPTERKVDALRENGSLHPKADSVTDELFRTVDFFDPHDMLQVKYEMVRRVRIEGEGVTGAAQSFGVSRPTVYQALSAFERGGLGALLPRRPGPRGAHKLTVEVVDFLVSTIAEEPDLRSVDLASRVREHFDVSVHPRTVERALRRREKKQAILP
jgi:transposase